MCTHVLQQSGRTVATQTRVMKRHKPRKKEGYATRKERKRDTKERDYPKWRTGKDQNTNRRATSDYEEVNTWAFCGFITTFMDTLEQSFACTYSGRCHFVLLRCSVSLAILNNKRVPRLWDFIFFPTVNTIIFVIIRYIQ